MTVEHPPIPLDARPEPRSSQERFIRDMADTPGRIKRHDRKLLASTAILLADRETLRPDSFVAEAVERLDRHSLTTSSLLLYRIARKLDMDPFSVHRALYPAEENHDPSTPFWPGRR